MSEKNPWTEQEDQAIIQLVNCYGVKKWTVVSEKMFEIFKLERRNAK
jgi:myb proto-oncogene protein